MRLQLIAAAVCAACFVSHAWAAPATRPIELREALFPLTEIRLDGGPLGDQQELNRRYLLQLEPDRLLSWFRREAGLDPKAPPYRGWESEGRPLPGHILGFYLSGASMTVESTGDEELKRRLNYIIDELATVQAANGNGYALAVPGGKQIFADIAKGNIKIDGLPWTGYQINGNFEPTYTLNKIMLGLKEVYHATGNQKAKQVLIALADWFGRDVLDHLNDDQTQTLLDCEHGSLHESFADVYALTGDAKYLTWARRLCHERMLAPLANGDVGFLTRYHANTQIPKFTGFERIYQLTGERKLDDAAMNFWNDVTRNRSWVIGGNSADEHFFPKTGYAKAMRSPAGPESCNSVNMLRLTEALVETHPSGELLDYYERTLFNHILAVHDPERAMCAYYTSMRPGTYRVYSDPFDSMWCCTGTGLEVPGKYGQMIYTHAADGSTVDVNLFAPSTLTWRESGVTLKQTTTFPSEAATTLTLTAVPTDGVKFALRVRHPAWVADDGLAITVNGESISAQSKRGDYAKIDRLSKQGDVVHIALPMTLHTESLPGGGYVALLYGPIVLSGELGREPGLSKLDFWQIRTTVPTKSLPDAQVPTFVTDDAATLLTKVKPVEGKPLTFRTDGLAQPHEVELIPFYQNHFQRYAIYWRTQTASQYAAEQQRLAADAKAAAELDARTIDRVAIGDDASEREHHLQSERSQSGTGAYGDGSDNRWRDARDGGWFSYDLKLADAGPTTVRLTFWGREQGPRTFDVLAGGKVVATISLGDTGEDAYIHRDLIVPAESAREGRITIRFQPKLANTAGGLFGIRTLRAQS